jgi:hypothetical protein
LFFAWLLLLLATGSERSPPALRRFPAPLRRERCRGNSSFERPTGTGWRRLDTGRFAHERAGVAIKSDVTQSEYKRYRK